MGRALANRRSRQPVGIARSGSIEPAVLRLEDALPFQARYSECSNATWTNYLGAPGALRPSEAPITQEPGANIGFVRCRAVAEVHSFDACAGAFASPRGGRKR